MWKNVRTLLKELKNEKIYLTVRWKLQKCEKRGNLVIKPYYIQKKKIQVNESRYKQCEVTPRPFVNLGIRTSALELELELILQTPLFPLPQGLSAPNLAGLWLRIRWPDPHSNVTLRYHGHVINKKRYISTFTRPIDLKLSRVVS